MRARVLLCFVATSYRVPAFVQAAERLGVELLLCTDAPATAAHHRLPVARADLARPDRGAAGVLDELGRPDGVLAVDEPSAELAAHVAVRAGVPFHLPPGVAAARDKCLLRRSLIGTGVGSPRFYVLDRLAQADQAAAEVGLPCVVKPAMLTGSQGVIRADDLTALRRAIVRVARILHRHPKGALSGAGFFRQLVESYVDGEEVVVEAMVHHGVLHPLAIFDKPDPLVGPYFEETMYVAPSRKPRALQAALVETARRAAEALGLVHGPVHAELRLGPAGPVLIEIAARSIGGLCSSALGPILGSLEERLLQNALGQTPRPLVGGLATGVMMLGVPRSGILRAVHGVESARAIPGVTGVNITVEPGEALHALPDGDRYAGFAFATGRDGVAVEAALRRARAAVTFEVKPLLPMW